MARVRRGATGVHSFVEYDVTLKLEGGTERSFTEGDNSQVVATDTCKNHVYLAAKTHPCDCPEDFARALCRRILHTYAHVTAVNVMVLQKPWKRATIRKTPHAHGFMRIADGTHVAIVDATRLAGREPAFDVRSKIERYQFAGPHQPITIIR